MKNPSPIYRYGYIAAIGFLFVGVLFSITRWPAAGLFSVVGGVASLVFYVIFNSAAVVKRGSDLARHVTFGALVVGQTLRALGQSVGSYFLFLALIGLLVWIVWSVLESLPPSED